MQNNLVYNTLELYINKAEAEVLRTMILHSTEVFDLQLSQRDEDGGLLSIGSVMTDDGDAGGGALDPRGGPRVRLRSRALAQHAGARRGSP